MSKLKIEIIKERLDSLFLNLVFKYATEFHAIKKTGSFYIPLEANASVNQAIAHILRLLANEDTKTLSISRNNLSNAYTKQHGIGSTELSSHARDSSTSTIVKILKPILIVSIPHHIKYHLEQDLLSEVNTSLNKFMEMEALSHLFNWILVKEIDLLDRIWKYFLKSGPKWLLIPKCVTKEGKSTLISFTFFGTSQELKDPYVGNWQDYI